jgi:hypothetical protein
MAKEFNMEVKGLKELEDLLVRELPAAMSRGVLLRALHGAAKPVIARTKVTGVGVRGGRSGALRLAMGTIATRFGAAAHHQLNQKAAAAIAGGPLSGQGSKPLLAWARYKQYYRKGRIAVKRGAPIGQIRHGHFVEFGFKPKGGTKVPGTHFLEKAVSLMAPTSARIFRKDLEKLTIRAIKRHNRRSPVKV